MTSQTSSNNTNQVSSDSDKSMAAILACPEVQEYMLRGIPKFSELGRIVICMFADELIEDWQDKLYVTTGDRTSNRLPTTTVRSSLQVEEFEVDSTVDLIPQF